MKKLLAGCDVSLHGRKLLRLESSFTPMRLRQVSDELTSEARDRQCTRQIWNITMPSKKPDDMTLAASCLCAFLVNKLSEVISVLE